MLFPSVDLYTVEGCTEVSTAEMSIVFPFLRGLNSRSGELYQSAYRRRIPLVLDRIAFTVAGNFTLTYLGGHKLIQIMSRTGTCSPTSQRRYKGGVTLLQEVTPDGQLAGHKWQHSSSICRHSHRAVR
jgi:hypothetical protein